MAVDTYYIDSRLSSGDNDGSSWANAFRSITALRNSGVLSVAGPNGIKLVFAKGSTYDLTSTGNVSITDPGGARTGSSKYNPTTAGSVEITSDDNGDSATALPIFTNTRLTVSGDWVRGSMVSVGAYNDQFLPGPGNVYWSSSVLLGRIDGDMREQRWPNAGSKNKYKPVDSEYHFALFVKNQNTGTSGSVIYVPNGANPASYYSDIWIGGGSVIFDITRPWGGLVMSGLEFYQCTHCINVDGPTSTTNDGIFKNGIVISDMTFQWNFYGIEIGSMAKDDFDYNIADGYSDLYTRAQYRKLRITDCDFYKHGCWGIFHGRNYYYGTAGTSDDCYIKRIVGYHIGQCNSHGLTYGQIHSAPGSDPFLFEHISCYKAYHNRYWNRDGCVCYQDGGHADVTYRYVWSWDCEQTFQINGGLGDVNIERSYFRAGADGQNGYWGCWFDYQNPNPCNTSSVTTTYDSCIWDNFRDPVNSNESGAPANDERLYTIQNSVFYRSGTAARAAVQRITNSKYGYMNLDHVQWYGYTYLASRGYEPTTTAITAADEIVSGRTVTTPTGGPITRNVLITDCTEVARTDLVGTMPQFDADADWTYNYALDLPQLDWNLNRPSPTIAGIPAKYILQKKRNKP